MKAQALLLIFAIFISYVISQSNKYALKSFPKKVRPYGSGKILINSGKYEPKVRQKATTKSHKRYTVFQVIGVSKTIQGVPDSPYFPVDQTYEHKPRVKKVLHEYPWSNLRSKRSAVLDAPPVENDKKAESTTESSKPVEETTTKPPTDKQNDDTKKVKDESKSTASVNTEGNTKPQTSDDKTTVQSSDTKTAKKSGSKRAKNGDTAKAKKEDAKRERKGMSANGDVKLRSENGADKPKEKEANPKADDTKVKVKNNATRSAVKSKPKNKGKSNKGAPTARNKKKNAGKIVKRNKNKKRKGKTNKQPLKHTGKGALKRNKNRKRPRKGQKGKQANGTRTARKPKAQRRLIAAREALIEDYPYVVSIQKNEQHWCSGALLNQRLVITTANCLWKSTRVSRMEIRAGSRHMDRDGQMAGIQEVIKHPGWGLRKSPDNDVALILLDRNIRFSDSVHAVDIPNRVMLPAFDDAWVTSWGAERRDGIYDADATALQVYHARLMNREKCNNITMRFSVIVTENFICLAQTGRNSPCTRDTGAPAVSDGILWGLASWGIRKLCGTERFPAMFSYLASHSNLDFITNATRFLMSDKRYYPFGDRYPTY